MGIKIGDKVKFINENLEGKIKSILSGQRLIVTCKDGFDYNVAVNEVLIVNNDNTHKYKIDDQIIANKINPKFKVPETSSVLSKYMESSKYKFEGIIEVDLHLEELVEFPGKLEDWQKLYTQMQHAKKCLNAALEKKIKKLIFIHGVGTGVLKMELQNYLASIDKIIVNDADFRIYGRGATEVIIKK